MLKRRNFLKTISFAGGSIWFSSPLFSRSYHRSPLRIACQQYPWQTFFEREGTRWDNDLQYSLQQVAMAGFESFEPLFNSVDEVRSMQPILKKHHLQMPSLYVNSVLHDPGQIESSMEQVLKVARAAKLLGIKIVVTNPSPIRWGGDEDKTDRQLSLQAKALDELGAKLRNLDLRLAYHNHDAEMRNSAREFHHMMQGTAPENVRLCLDAHWIYRGSGNSQVALFDIVSLYVSRIEELHLRQSRKGIWTEEFCQGDIDYQRLATYLLKHQKSPNLVLEQAVEKDTPHTMTGLQAHKKSLAYAREVFADFSN